MSDAHNPGPEFAPGVPEEFQNWYRKLHDQAVMSMEERQRRHDRFFDEMDKDSLMVLKDLMEHIERNPELATYVHGYIGGVLKYKFNVCNHCGENHDEAMFKHLGMTETEQASYKDAMEQINAAGLEADVIIPIIQNQDGKKGGTNSGDCATCRNDREFDVCTHPNGSHGQGMRDTCPDPLKLACPTCSAPTWALGLSLDDSPCHPDGGVLLFDAEENHCVCSVCGRDYFRLQS